MRILVVDDNDENLYYLDALLSAHGHEVQTARHGAEALVKARKAPPSVVISDLLMPVMDGYTLLRHWKADANLKTAPFVVYTATYTAPEDEKLALSLGADAFILKPAEPDAFIARLESVIAKATTATPAGVEDGSGDEERLLRSYSEILIRKLEQKTLELEESNRSLQRDIAGREVAESARRESEANFHVLTDAIPQIVWITRPDGWNVFFNQRWFDYTGLSMAESEGHGWSKPFHPDDASRAEEAWNRATTTGGTYSLEARLRRADGVYRSWLIRGVPQYNETGKIIRWFGTCTDIEELKEAAAKLQKTEAQLRQAQKMEAIGQLAGGVAHDFNNLLTVINGHGDMALARCSDDEALHHSITEIRRAGDRAADLTRQLLAFSRQQVLTMEILDVNAVISDHMNMLSRILGEDIELRVELSAETCSVEADAGQLAQVLLNLIANARDAMPTGGELLIRTRRAALQGLDDRPDGVYVALEVRDTGIGMDTTTLEHIFEPFFTTKEIGRGTGLGMSTVFGIVEQSRGHISVESKLQEGTTFHIFLPHVEATERDSRSEVVDHRDELEATETVLLVEDEPTVRGLIEEMLVERGYNVLGAGSPQLALDISETYADDIDLVLTDVVMPEMNGRQLVERIQLNRPNIRTLYVSGYANDAVLARGVLSANQHFLQKPFTASQLSEKVRDALRRP